MVVINGLVWTQPVADVLSTILVIFLYRKALNDMQLHTSL